MIRTKTKVTGGITAEEKIKLAAVKDEWIGIALRTEPIEPGKTIPTIEGLYAAAGLKKPRVVIVPSPRVMAAAYGAAAWIWHCRKNATDAAVSDATDGATDGATNAATRVATDAVTYAAVSDATYGAAYAVVSDATYGAVSDATDAATYDAVSDATDAAVSDVTYAAVSDATYDATDAAVSDATYDAVSGATDAATDGTTYAAVSDATRVATDAATNAATRVATYGATYDATYDATRVATYAATDAAVSDATDGATDGATNAATRVATDAVTYAAVSDATYGAAYAVVSDATDAATYAATDGTTNAATRVATYDASYAAAHDATKAATYTATNAATNDATTPMQTCFALAGKGGVECAKLWSKVYQGGNMWAGWCAYINGFRDVLGLDLPEHKNYKFYEEAARHGSFRVMHEEFCMVSDFPEYIKMDAENRPHCENGPSHRWRDGWELFHWHGVVIPGEWVTGKKPSASEAINWPNIEQRRAACEIVGWKSILKGLDAKVIDADGDPEIGTLLECDIPDSGKERFLQVRCGTGRSFVLPVPREIKTAIEGNAWTYGLDAKDFQPEVRT